MNATQTTLPLDTQKIGEAAEKIRMGGVVAFPTETGYGLGASILVPEALERIFSIKKRPSYKPLLVLISQTAELDLLVSDVPAAAIPLMDRFWPGPLTLLLPARPDIHNLLTADTGKIGVRISSNPWATELIKKAGVPITATSANLSGQEMSYSAQEVASALASCPPDYILDGGVISPGPPSTIVDITQDPPLIVREGAIPPKDILT